MQTAKVPVTPQYPDRPITMIVPFSAGSGLDVLARTLEKGAYKHLGQPLVVTNRPGGTGTLGWNEVVGAKPDGYTIGVSSVDVLLNPLYGQTKYHYMTALEPLAQVSVASMSLAIQSEKQWNNLDDLIEYSRQHPGEVKFGHPGIGSVGHVIGESFAKAAGITLQQVPFQGANEATAALLGGHVQIVFASPAIFKEYVKAGTIRVLALTAEKRSSDPIFAQTPLFKEKGLDVSLNTWFGVVAPKELPAEVKEKLVIGLMAIITDPEFKANMERIGIEVSYLGPKETAARWQADNDNISKIVNETGILELIKTQKQ